MKNSSILITGGAGAIGVNLVERLIEINPKEIVIIDNLSSGNKEFLPESNLIKFNEVDISNKVAISEIFRKHEFDYIFHLAAHFANQNSVDHPHLDIQTNINGTVNLLELSKDQKQLKKFLYSSSSCVYGSSQKMSECDFIYPSETPYSINKYTAELYVKHFSHLYDIPALSIRIFNSYGPYEIAGKYRNVIPNFIELALRNEPLIITGDGTETRDFTYVDDTISLFFSAAKSKERSGDYFNAGTGIETKISHLAQKIIELSGSKSEIIFKERRNWDLVSKRVSDLTKTKDTFSYLPIISFDEGLKKYIQWYKTFLKVQE